MTDSEKTSPNIEDSTLTRTTLGEVIGESCFQNGIYKNSEAYGAGQPIIRITDFSNEGRLMTDTFNRVALSESEFTQYAVRENDILINRVNSLTHIGKSMLVHCMSEYPVYESNMMRLRLSSDSALAPEYVAAVLQANPARNYFRRVAKTAVAQASINQDDVRGLAIVLYPKHVQKRLACAIFTWDQAIEKTRQLIAAKDRRLSALRTKLFARGNRPGYARVRLESILTETGELSDGSLPVYSVSVHKGLINQVEHLGRSFSAATTDHYNLVRPGDIVYTKSPTGEFPYGIVKQSLAKEDAAVSPLYGVYRPSTDDIGTLLDFYFQSPTNAKNYLHPLVQKGAKNTISITNDQFLKGEISLPESADQVARLARFVRESRTEIALLEESVAALTIQKRGLMQKLLTGHWRLPVIEGQPIPDHA